MERPIKELLNVYREGDHLTTPELVRLRDHMKELSELSAPFGDLFHLETVYARNVSYNCEDFIRARSRKK